MPVNIRSVVHWREFHDLVIGLPRAYYFPNAFTAGGIDIN